MTCRRVRSGARASPFASKYAVTSAGYPQGRDGPGTTVCTVWVTVAWSEMVKLWPERLTWTCGWMIKRIWLMR